LGQLYILNKNLISFFEKKYLQHLKKLIYDKAHGDNAMSQKTTMVERTTQELRFVRVKDASADSVYYLERNRSD